MKSLVEQIRELRVVTTILNPDQEPIRVEFQNVAMVLAGAGYEVDEVSTTLLNREGEGLLTEMVAIVDPEDNGFVVAELGTGIESAIAVLEEEFADSDSLRESGSVDHEGWYHELIV